MMKCSAIIASVCYALVVFAPGAGAQSVLPSAVAMRDVDLDATRSFHGGKALEADAAKLADVLGLDDGGEAWPGGAITGVAVPGKPAVFHYRVAFSRAVEIGTIMADLDVRLLKPDAPYPGNPDSDADWLAPPADPRQGSPRVIPLAKGTAARAVLCTQRITRGASQLGQLWLLQGRFHNVMADAVANAPEEYHRAGSAYGPTPAHTYAAADVASGRGAWIGSGLDENGRNLRPPVSELNPTWFAASWQQPREIRAIHVNDNFLEFKLLEFIGEAGINPAIASDREWRRVRAFKEHRRGGRWIVFDQPLATRGIKFDVLKVGAHANSRITQITAPQGNTQFNQSAAITAMHVLTDLGDAPVPDFRPPAGSNPPLALPYSLEHAGIFTMVVDDASGIRMRNIVARAARDAGRHTEYWDLKDEKGAFVPPGKYRWKAIYSPPLELRYEMTPYPNVPMVSPDRAPWLTAINGPDGWMADHTPSNAVSAGRNLVFMGARVAESGVPLIACDFNGTKQWGTRLPGGWGVGVKMLAADETDTAYIGANAPGDFYQRASMDPATEIIFAADAAGAIRELAVLPPTESRKRGIKGMAAADGSLYLSVWNTESTIQNAASAAHVDVEHCVPRYPPRRKERFENEVVPDPRSDFLRLFRLMGTPPGMGRELDLTVLTSFEAAGARQHIVLAFHKPVSLGSVAYPVPQGQPHTVKLSVLKADAPYPPDHEDEAQWMAFEDSGSAPWDVVPAPKNTRTRALRVTFLKGADDIFAALDDEKSVGGTVDALLGGDDDEAEPEDDGLGAKKKAWQGTIEGMKLLRSRYANLAPAAKVSVSSGSINKIGEWDAERTEPLTEGNPGIYMLEWEKKQAVCGLAIEEIDGARTEIDVYTGPDAGAIDMKSAANWRNVATYYQDRRNHWSGTDGYNGQARYLDGYVDFGGEVNTRAVRLRVVEQWYDGGWRGLMGVRRDRGGQALEPARCRIYGVAVLQSIGGEDPIDPAMRERIEVVDVKTGKIAREIPARKPGRLAWDRSAGTLHMISERKVLRIDAAGGKHAPLGVDAIDPRAMTFDKQGDICVYDGDPERQNVRVYDKAGKPIRTIGTPGGCKAGPWDPTRLANVKDMTIDAQDQLWAVEENFYPKRYTIWSIGGQFRKELLGNTEYGGGGILDYGEKSRLFYGPLEFELNWQTGKTRPREIRREGTDRG